MKIQKVTSIRQHIIKTAGILGAFLLLGASVLGVASSKVGAEASPSGPAASSNGSLVAYQTNDGVFVKNRTTGDVTEVSTNAAGEHSDGWSANPKILDDGVNVAFFSYGSNLVEQDTEGHANVFLKNIQSGDITLLSTDASDNVMTENVSQSANITSDGKYLVFMSRQSDLVVGDTNDSVDVFRKDLQTGTIVRVSTASNGAQADDESENSNDTIAITPDGRFVGFTSAATNLVNNDTNSQEDIFVKDLQTGEMNRANTDSNNDESAGGQMTMPTLSNNGRYAAFISEAGDLVDNITGSAAYRKDLQTGDIIQVDTNSEGADVETGSPMLTPLLSGDGSKVVIVYYQGSLTEDVATETSANLFLKNITTQEVNLISKDSQGNAGDGYAMFPSWTSNGKFVTLYSTSTNLDYVVGNASSDWPGGVVLIELPGDLSGDIDGNLATLTNPKTNKPIILELDDACTLNSASVSLESSNSTKDSGYDYNNGLVSFSADCGQSGYSTTVIINYYGVEKNSLVLRKYNPIAKTYTMIDNPSITQQTVQNQSITTVTYSVKDGGQYDIDGTANGTIVDPVGLASESVGVPNTGL